MKILYASQARIPAEVTHTLSILRMCQALTDAGHEVVLGAIAEGPARSEAEILQYYGLQGGFQVRAFAYARRRLLGMAHAKNLVALFRESRADLVYSRLCLLPLHRLPKSVPIVFEMHSPGPVAHSFRQRKLFEKTVLAHSHKRIITSTDLLRGYLLDRYPDLDVVTARLSAEPPVNIDAESLERFGAESLRARPGEAGRRRFRVGYTGFLDTIGLRGTEILCRLAERMPELDFHVVGGTPEAVRYWEAQARSVNLFFYGHQNPAQIPHYLRSFDVVLAPLQLRVLKSAPFGRNMSPLKLSQYLAYGRAIVASDLPTHRELIQNGHNGLLVPPEDLDQWEAAIRRLQEEPGLKERLERAAEESYAGSLTPAKRVATILEGFAAA